MANDGNINWDELNLVEDEASAEGTRALRFLTEQIHQAQRNPLLRPTLQSLMRANDMVLVVEDREEDEQHEERGDNRQAESPQ